MLFWGFLRFSQRAMAMGGERKASRGTLYGGALVVAVVLVLASAQPSAAFYEKGSDVLMLDSTSYMPKIAKSNFLWLVGETGGCIRADA